MGYRKRKLDFEDDDINDNSLEEEPLEEDFPLDEEISPEEAMYQSDFDDGGMDMGGVAPMEKHGDLLKDLTNFDPYLKKKMYEWMGYIFDIKQGKYVPDNNIEPLLNYVGARRMISFLSTFARGNNIITDLDIKSYNELMIYVIETMAYSIGPYKEEYGITDNAKFLYFWNDLQSAIILVLQGAGGGKYSDLLRTTVHRNESFSGMMNQQNMGGGNYNNMGMVQPQMQKKGFLRKTVDFISGGK